MKKTVLSPTIGILFFSLVLLPLAATYSAAADTTPPLIVSRETQDADGDGYIDGILITFNEQIDHQNVFASSFAVAGITGITATATGGNTAVLLEFTDGVLAGGATPMVTVYEGAVQDKKNNLIAYSPPTVSSDKAAPVLWSAVAGDGSAILAGIDADDSVILTFSEKTAKPVITAANLDSVFALGTGHVWGAVRSVEWNANGDALTVYFSGGSSSTIEPGDKITVKNSAIADPAGNFVSGSLTLSGSFGGTPPEIVPPEITSTLPDDKQRNVAVTSSVEMTFSKDMDEQSLLSASGLFLVKDENSASVDIPVSVSKSYNATARKITLTPLSPLRKNCTYEARVSTLAADTEGGRLKKAAAIRFYTVLDFTKPITIEGDDQKTKLLFEPDTVPEDASVTIINDPLDETQSAEQATDRGKITAAVSKVVNSRDDFKAVIPGTMRELILRSPDGKVITSAFDKPVMLTIPYPDTDNDGIVDGTTPPVRVRSLQTHYLDEEHSLWVRVPGSAIDTDAKAVTAPLKHFSVYVLLGAPDTDLSAAYAFPVPFLPSRGDTSITFTNLSSRATIKIFTLSGELVKAIEHASGNAQLQWDATNDRGEKVASGTYLYVIKSDRDTKKGKLMIVR